MAAILDAQGLNKSFGAVTAASDINVAVEKDSVLGLIGTNGAGKTTFINMITGYLKPDRGRIHYEGRDITALAPRDITRIGICRSFQIPQLYASLTAFENMMVGIGVVLQNAGRGGFFSRGEPLVPGYDLPAGGGRRAAAGALRPRAIPRQERAGAARRGAQAPRHRAHHGGEAQDPAAR